MADGTASAGYHLRAIPRGELGEVSKIREELEELEDAVAQDSAAMALVELADLIGAVKLYLEKHHPSIRLEDLDTFSVITRRAFAHGQRTARP